MRSILVGQAIIIFIRNPLLGKVKTRLAANIGEKEALQIYLRLLEKTKQETKKLGCNKYLFYSDFIDPTDNWEEFVYNKELQTGKDLGERIYNAFERVFLENNSVIIIGSDCYDLTAREIENAFKELQKKDMVIGPAEDGGYYLLGLNENSKELFSGIEWSSEDVLETTLKKASALNKSFSVLKELIDVDTIEDLKRVAMS